MDKKDKIKEALKKKLKQETSVTGTGASVTPGVGAGVATKYAFESAMFFFERNKLWAICDKGINDAAILELTKRINGGTHGLEDRKAKTYKYYQFVK